MGARQVALVCLLLVTLAALVCARPYGTCEDDQINVTSNNNAGYECKDCDERAGDCDDASECFVKCTGERNRGACARCPILPRGSDCVTDTVNYGNCSWKCSGGSDFISLPNEPGGGQCLNQVILEVFLERLDINVLIERQSILHDRLKNLIVPSKNGITLNSVESISWNEICLLVGVNKVWCKGWTTPVLARSLTRRGRPHIGLRDKRRQGNFNYEIAAWVNVVSRAANELVDLMETQSFQSGMRQAVEDTLGSNVEVNGIVAIDWEDWNPDGNSPDNTGSDPTTLEQRSFGEGTTPTGLGFSGLSSTTQTIIYIGASCGGLALLICIFMIWRRGRSVPAAPVVARPLAIPAAAPPASAPQLGVPVFGGAAHIPALGMVVVGASPSAANAQRFVGLPGAWLPPGNDHPAPLPPAPSGAQRSPPASSGGAEHPLVEVPDSNQCQMCLDAAREILALPCRHAALCRSCFTLIMQRNRLCIICRTPMESYEISDAPGGYNRTYVRGE